MFLKWAKLRLLQLMFTLQVLQILLIEMCLLFSFILLSCSTVRKVTLLAKLRSLLESCSVCLLQFSQDRANMRGRMEL